MAHILNVFMAIIFFFILFLYLNISLAEFLRILKLILNHVDWSEVAFKITGNRKLLIYREAIILILYTQVYELKIKKAKEKKEKKEKKDKKD